MSEGFDKLKDIGAQKIHEATHIARAHVESMLNENFDNMNNIQFLGFISILEREYSVDLSEFKNKGIVYFDENMPEVKEETKVKVFVSPKKKRTLTLIYIGIGVLIFVAFALLNTVSTNGEISKVTKVDNSAIDSAKSNILTVDKNDTNRSVINKDIEVKELKEPQNEIISFKIIPEHEVWLGYIDLDTYKKYQKTFTDEFALDPSKDWLLAFGHGHISIEVNGIIKKYSNPKNVRFSYVNSELKELSFTEFKDLNRGNRW